MPSHFKYCKIWGFIFCTKKSNGIWSVDKVLKKGCQISQEQEKAELEKKP